MIMRWVVMVAVLMAATPVRAQEERVSELERKVDLLTEEIERLRLGAVADTTVPLSRVGYAPAASKVYGAGRGVSIGGYGEMLLERFDHPNILREIYCFIF